MYYYERDLQPGLTNGVPTTERDRNGADESAFGNDGETMHHKEGEIIVFDDSQKHSAFNHHPTDSRAVLIFDLERPKEVPPGIATGIVTTELASFIDYFK